MLNQDTYIVNNLFRAGGRNEIGICLSNFSLISLSMMLYSVTKQTILGPLKEQFSKMGISIPLFSLISREGKQVKPFTFQYSYILPFFCPSPP